SGSMAGVAALSTSVASLNEETTITLADVNSAEFTTWFSPLRDSMLNSERLSGNPAQVMASRGTSAADFALLPESQWLTELDTLTSDNTFIFAYPAYQMALDFPVAIWRDTQTSSNENAAVQSFTNFLLSDGQAIALAYGFRPANTVLDDSATLFNDAMAAGILLEPPLENRVILLNRSVAEQLITLVD
ncbi:MAG: substrate-binding domain-containing protein, partial [Chloroflexota bacterium]